MQPTDLISPHVAAIEFVAGTVKAKRANKWAERSGLLTGQALAEAKRVCAVIEKIREIVGRPVYLTSGIRPGSGKSQHAQIRHVAPRQQLCPHCHPRISHQAQ